MSNTTIIEKMTGRKSELDTRTFRIEILTPVHVGSGREFTKDLDFSVSTDHTLLFNMDSLFRRFKDESGFMQAIERGDITGYLDRQAEGQDTFYKEKLPGAAEGNNVREFMTLGNGKPTIPGSSLKGAIRTALFSHFFAKSGITLSEYKSLLGKNPKWAAGRIEQKVLTGKLPEKRGKPDFGKAPNYDIGRAIRAGDAEFSREDLEVLNIRVMNLGSGNGNSYGYGWKELSGRKRSHLSYEESTPVPVIVTGPGCVSSEFRISIDSAVFGHIGWPEQNQFTWEQFAEVMNSHARKIAGYEYEFLTGVASRDDDTKEMAEILKEDIISKIGEGDNLSWVQQVGWGTGWHSKTGLHITDVDLMDDIRAIYRLGRKEHPVFPKSRKVAPELDIDENEHFPAYFMGWIKVEEIRDQN
ncbi:MAG: type III-A CRISPR-associated RAMP protein Csm5 [Cyclonatronaceae bacterium]